MLGFLFRKAHEEVRPILHGRMNRAFVQQVGEGDRRHSRSAMCEVVWLITYDEERREPDFDAVTVAVSRDISGEGLSVIHTKNIDAERVVVGLQSEMRPAFMLCRVQHTTSLGYGFYHIGLFPECIVDVNPVDIDALRRRLEVAPETDVAVCENP